MSSICVYQNIDTVTLAFQGKQCAGNPGDAYPSFYVSTPAPGFSGGQSYTFRDTASAYYNAPTSGAPTNQATLDALAVQFGTDFIRWLGFSGDQSFAGIAAIQPTGLYEYLAIDYLHEGTCKTRVVSPPFVGFPRELGHYDGAHDCALTSFPCIDYYGPPGQCSGTSIQLTRYKLCLQDGRLLSTFVSTDSITT